MSNTNVLFTDKDILTIVENLPRLQDEADILRNKILKPSVKTQKRIIDAIVNFTIEKKRKIYGGYAMNELLMMVDPKHRIYEDGSVNDVDFYSPRPIDDLIDLCDILHEMEVGDVRAREALHGQTYSIFVDDENYCDISYTPPPVFNRMPFKKSPDGLILIHYHFMWIDYFRMLTDPIGSWFRIEKSIKRFAILQKVYPFPSNMNTLKLTEGNTPEVEDALNAVFSFIDNRDTLILLGTYAYNCLLEESGAHKRMSGGKRSKNRSSSDAKNNQRTSDKTLKFIDVPHYEMISVDYKKDAKELLELLKSKFPDNPNMIECVEHYPFYEYTGFHANIYCNDFLVATIYDNHHKCYPSKVLKTKYYAHDTSKHFTTKGKVRLGTYTVILMYAMINIQRARVENTPDSENDKKLYYTLASQMIHMRNYFFDTHPDISILDDTIFQEMSTDCVGTAMSIYKEKRLRIEKNLRDGRRVSFTYNPENKLQKRPVVYFPKSSGEPIQKKENLVLGFCKISEKEGNSDKNNSEGKNEDIELESVEIVNENEDASE